LDRINSHYNSDSTMRGLGTTTTEIRHSKCWFVQS